MKVGSVTRAPGPRRSSPTAAAETDEFDVDRLVVYRILKEPPE